jgi:diacylglycerol kinase family enzyme
MDDGRFEMIVFPQMPRSRLLKAVWLAQRGRMFELPEIQWIQVTRAEVECDRVVRFFGDGEILEQAKSFSLSIAPEPVKIMAPVVAEPVVELHAALERA